MRPDSAAISSCDVRPDPPKKRRWPDPRRDSGLLTLSLRQRAPLREAGAEGISPQSPSRISTTPRPLTSQPPLLHYWGEGGAGGSRQGSRWGPVVPGLLLLGEPGPVSTGTGKPCISASAVSSATRLINRADGSGSQASCSDFLFMIAFDSVTPETRTTATPWYRQRKQICVRKGNTSCRNRPALTQQWLGMIPVYSLFT